MRRLPALLSTVLGLALAAGPASLSPAPPVGMVAVPAVPALPDSLARWLDGLGGDSLLVQISLVECRSDGPPRPLYGRQAELRQTPASLTKLFTAAAALELWPAEHRFTTRVAWDPGELAVLPRSQELQVRHLWVEAGGDPTLTVEDLRDLFMDAWQSGVDRLAGPVCILPNRFSKARLGPGWMWDDEGEPYCARPSALTVENNCLAARPERGGWILPGSALLRVETVPAARGGKAALRRDWLHGRDEFEFISPWLPAGAGSGTRPRWRAKVPDPAVSVEFPDSLFRSACFEAAQEVFGSRTPPVLLESLALPPAPVWRTHHSPPVVEILDSILTHSWNLGAECVFQGLTLTHDEPGPPWEQAARLVERVARDSLGIAGWRRQVDGSGLSRYNAMAPRQFTDLLAAMERRHPGVLRGLLPGAGEGTLRQDPPRLPEGVALAAKTGSLRGVTGLAGYLEADQGPRLAFCVLITGHPSIDRALRIRNQVVERLAGWLAGGVAP